jgi:DNA-binding FadR family transcriptional regulator
MGQPVTVPVMAARGQPVKYTAIAADLRLLIAAGQLNIGDRVPSESVLCARYRVSKMTAARALEQLVDDGLIVRRSGSGSFVTARPPVRVITAPPGSRITARPDRGAVVLRLERPGADPEQHPAETTIIVVAEVIPWGLPPPAGG